MSRFRAFRPPITRCRLAADAANR